MSRENVIFDWLIATNPAGFLCGSTAANDPGVEATFTGAHQRAGHTVTRLSFDEAKARLKECRPPARELCYAPRPNAPITPKSETAADLPAITEQVMVRHGPGIVVAHLSWPDHHPTHAGRVAAHVVGIGFECLAYPGQARPYRPEPVREPPPDPPSSPVPAVSPAPTPAQPTLF